MILTWRKGFVAAAAIGLVAAAYSGVLAEGEKGDAGAKMAKFLERHPEADTDGDGALSKEEIDAFRSQRGPGAAGKKEKAGPKGVGRPDPATILKDHPEADTDGDGKLSPDELRAFGRGQLTERILAEHPQADTDGDGKLSKEELVAFHKDNPGFGLGGPLPRGPMAPPALFFDWMLERFEKADTDGSGGLSRDEIIKLKEQFAAPPGMGWGMGPGPGFGRGMGPGPGPGKGMGPMGKGPGAGKGGSRTPSPEMRQRVLERFPDADADGDGQLSDEEFKALKEKWPSKEGKHLRRGAGSPPAEDKEAADKATE